MGDETFHFNSRFRKLYKFSKESLTVKYEYLTKRMSEEKLVAKGSVFGKTYTFLFQIYRTLFVYPTYSSCYIALVQ